MSERIKTIPLHMDRETHARLDAKRKQESDMNWEDWIISKCEE